MAPSDLNIKTHIKMAEHFEDFHTQGKAEFNFTLQCNYILWKCAQDVANSIFLINDRPTCSNKKPIWIGCIHIGAFELFVILTSYPAQESFKFWTVNHLLRYLNKWKVIYLAFPPWPSSFQAEKKIDIFVINSELVYVCYCCHLVASLNQLAWNVLK